MKRTLVVLGLSILLIILSILFENYSKTIPRWWGWLVGGVDTLAEDGILASTVALV